MFSTLGILSTSFPQDGLFLSKHSSTGSTKSPFYKGYDCDLFESSHTLHDHRCFVDRVIANTCSCGFYVSWGLNAKFLCVIVMARTECNLWIWDSSSGYFTAVGTRTAVSTVTTTTAICHCHLFALLDVDAYAHINTSACAKHGFIHKWWIRCFSVTII